LLRLKRARHEYATIVCATTILSVPIFRIANKFFASRAQAGVWLFDYQRASRAIRAVGNYSRATSGAQRADVNANTMKSLR
jgi:hypothetical protein